MTDQAAILARLERLERLVAALVPDEGDWLASELRAAYPDGRAFLARDAWDLAEAAGIRARVAGDPQPDICEAMLVAGATSVRRLGRWLAQQEGRTAARVGRDGAGTYWRMLHSPNETSTP